MSPCFTCDRCGKTFTKRYNLNRHIRFKHLIPVEFKPKKSTDYKCAVCEIVFSKLKDFNDHLPTDHNTELKTDELEFKTEHDFNLWKETVEKQETAFYVKRQSTYYYGLKVNYYYCHRSGYFRETVKPHERQRHIKIQGSSKMNAYCPARIKALSGDDGLIYVEYCSTHFGHKMDLAHMNISVDEKKELASKIEAKIPFDAILADVKTPVNNKLQRSHLITKQDLRNIVRDFSLNDATLNNEDNSEDVLSVDAWVKKESSGENHCLILYKPVGVINPQYSNIKSKDFMLGIMNKAQAETLKKYGSNCICMVSTCNTLFSNYEMTTLLVLDDRGRSFPCAVFFSNRKGGSGLDIFLTAVRDKVGTISCKVLVTEVEEVFYNSWANIMGDSEKRLSSTVKVVKQSWLKKLDQNKYKEKLRKNSKDKMYAVHGVNSGMHLEALFSMLKQLHFKWKSGKSLDKSIQTVTRFISLKLSDCLLVLEKGKITYKLRTLRQRHKTSMSISFDNVTESSEDSWSMLSSSSTEVFKIERAEKKCNCSLVCVQCKACIHNFKCSCTDSSVKWNMCEHIHLICRMLQTKQNEATNEISVVTDDHCCTTPSVDSTDSEITPIHIDEAEKVKENNIILKNMTNYVEKIDNSDLETLKKKILDECNLIVKNLTCVEQVNLMESNLKTLKPLLASVEEQKRQRIERLQVATTEINQQCDFIMTDTDFNSIVIMEFDVDDISVNNNLLF